VVDHSDERITTVAAGPCRHEAPARRA
jgi:hypothetical protein